jgi:hypothetical protein
MTRFWFEFEKPLDEIQTGLSLGCDVTAVTYEIAIATIQNKIFKEKQLPEISKVISDVRPRPCFTNDETCGLARNNVSAGL